MAVFRLNVLSDSFVRGQHVPRPPRDRQEIGLPSDATRSEALQASPYPWIAIRSPHQANGAVRNVRITGKPEVPTEIYLTATPDLPGWMPVNEEDRVGLGRKWQFREEVKNGGGIMHMMMYARN